MERSKFIRSLTGIGLSTFGLNAFGSYSDYAKVHPDKMPAYINAADPDFERIREDFPRVRDEVYMDNASTHPINIYTAAALHRYTEWAKNEVGEPWWPNWSDSRQDLKKQFAKLINADESEIAFARSTVESENNIVNWMDFTNGNVVTTDLHYTASLYSYKMREQRDKLKVKIIRHNDWQFDASDFEKVVDKKTKLVAVTLVSNVNGFAIRDLKKITDIAHANGAIVYVDFIQGVGAVPVDVKAMGIDIAACSTFKWLMGSKGFGFLYVRKDLQDTIVRTDHHNGGVKFNYAPWTDNPDPSKEDIIFSPSKGPGMYEVSYPSYEGVTCALASLKYIHAIGVDNIRKYVRTLTNRLVDELPKIGYACITPKDNESPILAFVAKDPDNTMKRLRSANIHCAMRFGNKLRISPSIYNNQSDIDRIVKALS